MRSAATPDREPHRHLRAGLATSGFQAVRDLIVARSTAFGRPVLLVHGDEHRYAQEVSYAGVANVIRLETSGTPRSTGCAPAVDPRSDEVVSWTTEQVGLPSRPAERPGRAVRRAAAHCAWSGGTSPPVSGCSPGDLPLVLDGLLRRLGGGVGQARPGLRSGRSRHPPRSPDAGGAHAHLRRLVVVATTRPLAAPWPREAPHAVQATCRPAVAWSCHLAAARPG